jgi:glyoxylase I family protein
MALIRYIVSDVPRAVAFYSQKLGFKVEKQVGRAVATLVYGDISLRLSGPESFDGRPLADGRKPASGGWNRFVLEVDKIDQIATALRNADVQFRLELSKTPYGKVILVEDPDGNPIELLQRSTGV